MVRTIHGYGYAFVAEISAAGPITDAETRSYRIILGDREIALVRGAHLLGRAPDVTICVDDSGVSRHHARITIGPQGAVLEDLASKNGTMLNGKPLQAPATLVDGSLIVLGATALKFRVIEAVATTDTISRRS